MVMPIGNYDGVYPPARQRELILREFGLVEARPVLAFLGGVWSYKGIDVTREAFGELQDKFQLIVSSDPRNDINMLHKAFDCIRGVQIVPRLLSPQEFSDIVSVSEMLLLPYRKITGSGMFMAAMTLSRGVVASNLPYFREMLSGFQDAGRLFEAGNAQALKDAVCEYVRVPADRRAHAARRLASQCSWLEVIQPVRVALQECARRQQTVKSRCV